MPDIVKTQTVIKPQDGFQVEFLSSPADIVIAGGAAGVGKSWCLLINPLRHKQVPGFNCMIFRRTTEQIRNPGGLWDKSIEIYPNFSFKASEQYLEWYTLSTNVTIKFSHLQYEKDIRNHDGSEYCVIEFDELQSFTKKQFFYLLSRNRSTCGVKPYVLATCNPDPDCFLAELLEWWIDQREKLPDGTKNPQWGYPIKSRSGKIRYLFVYEEKYLWGDSKKEIIEKHIDIFVKMGIQNPESLIKSITFISGTIDDNQELLRTNPGYLANLAAQEESEKLRLLYGNWKVRAKDESIFNSVCVGNMFENIYPTPTSKKYITVDAARFGDDFCTIFTWAGWKVVGLDVLTVSDDADIIRIIERQRAKYNIPKSNVIVDQDGVGGGVVKLGRYIGYSGNDKVMIEKVTEIKEDYKNKKTQFAYRFAEKVNNDEVSIILSLENCSVDGHPGLKIKINDVVVDIRDLISQDLRAIKRKDKDSDGKKQINDKADQKRLLNGRSPDFFDGMHQRVYFDMKDTQLTYATSSKDQKPYSNQKYSLLDRM